MKALIIILAASLAMFTSSAQKGKANKKITQSSVALQSNYSCPMHRDVISNVPGKCNKCKMDLTLSKKELMKKAAIKDYSCPMHKEVANDMAGTCAKCGTALVVVDRRGSKQGQTTYVCSMHSDVVAQKSGNCPKCGMKLTKVKTEGMPKKG